MVENMEEAKSLVFRINMHIIEELYNTCLEEITAVVEKANIIRWGKEPLYNIMMTNRTDFSKYKSGLKEPKITKRMTKLYSICPQLQEFLTGDKLIEINEMNLKKWKVLLDSKDKKEIELTVRNHTYKIINGIVKEYKNIYGTKKVMDGPIYCANKEVGDIVIWLVNGILEEQKGRTKSVDLKIKEAMECIKDISFSELKMCNENTVKEMAKVCSEFNKMVQSVNNYKIYEAKERKNRML